MAEAAPPSLPKEIQRLRFLIAEQNPALQKTIIETLRQGGAHDIHAAATGTEAWEIWQNQKGIHVVLCAAALPGLGGQEILTRIRSDKGTDAQPAFVLTSLDSSDPARRKALEEGADVFLPKPFPAEVLVAKVIEAVALRVKASGAQSFIPHSLEQELLGARLPVELVFDRYTTEVECQELTQEKCVIRVTNNYGLGTQLNLRFLAPGGAREPAYKPIKGTVMKTERVPKEIGLFLLHVQFNNKAREEHGILHLLRSGGGGPA